MAARETRQPVWQHSRKRQATFFLALVHAPPCAVRARWRGIAPVSAVSAVCANRAPRLSQVPHVPPESRGVCQGVALPLQGPLPALRSTTRASDSEGLIALAIAPSRSVQAARRRHQERASLNTSATRHGYQHRGREQCRTGTGVHGVKSCGAFQIDLTSALGGTLNLDEWRGLVGRRGMGCVGWREDRVICFVLPHRPHHLHAISNGVLDIMSSSLHTGQPG